MENIFLRKLIILKEDLDLIVHLSGKSVFHAPLNRREKGSGRCTLSPISLQQIQAIIATMPKESEERATTRNA